MVRGTSYQLQVTSYKLQDENPCHMRPKAKADKAVGFSLVELLVALLLTLFLMAGLSTVFKSSVSSFAATGESVSSVRRNRLSIELLGEDINMAGMYLTDMAMPPFTQSRRPPFCVIPNADIENPGQDGSDPKKTDELYFYLDEPMPFEGTLKSSPAHGTAADAVLSGSIIGPSAGAYTVDCQSSDYAKQLEDYANQTTNGQTNRLVAIFKDFWEAIYVDALSANGRYVTFSVGTSPTAGITGMGSQGLPSRVNHRDESGGTPGAGVMFVKPAQVVAYLIEMVPLLDPAKPDEGIPCLVRRQGGYSYSGDTYVASSIGPRQIITENVTGFKVYISANGGREWAGYGSDASGFDKGWDWGSGMRGQIDKQLSVVGRPGQTSTRGSEHWFRSIPILVRVDVTTRTATKRSEYSANYAAAEPKAAYKTLTQTLIFVPRHFGLPMN